MVQSVAEKVKHILTIGQQCVEKSIHAIDHDINLITEWMNKCIEDHSFIDKDVDLDFSLGKDSGFDSYALFSEMVLPSEQAEDIKKDTNKIDSSKIEESIIKKYSDMSFIELKEQCNRFGITCSGLRNDYIKKLVTYELLQQGITPSHPISVPPRVNLSSSPTHKPVQRQPIIFPKLNTSLSNTSIDKSSHQNQQIPPSSSSPRYISNSIQKNPSSINSPTAYPILSRTVISSPQVQSPSKPTYSSSIASPPSSPIKTQQRINTRASPLQSPKQGILLKPPTIPTTPPSSHPTIPTSPPSSHPTIPISSPSSRPAIPTSPPLSHPTIPSTPPSSHPTIPSTPPSSPPISPPNSPRVKRQGIHRSPAPPISSPRSPPPKGLPQSMHSPSSPRSPPLRGLPQSMHSPSPPSSPYQSKYTPSSPLTKPTGKAPPPPSSSPKPHNSTMIDTIENQFKRPQIPDWARNPCLFEECVKQHRNAILYNFTPDRIFSFPDSMDLEEVLGIYLRRNVNERGSSANWTEEVLKFKAEMMEVVDLSDDGIVVAEPESEESTDSWYSLLSE